MYLKINKNSLQSILSGIDKILYHGEDPSNIIFNSTDGHISINIVITNKLLELGSNTIVYDRFTNTYNLHKKDSIAKYKIKKSVDIKNHLILKGYDILSYTKKSSLDERKIFIKEITKNLAQFKVFANDYVSTNSSKGFYRNLISKIGRKEEHFVKGSIFEEYIYWLIKDNLEVDDVMTSVSVQIEKNILNEIDILIMKNNHLHAIECKFTDNFKTTEYLYKVDSIMSYLDDDGKGMILSIGRKTLGPHDIARSKNFKINFYGVAKFNEKHFINELSSWFNINKIN